MNAWEELVLSYVLNACWQLPAIALAAWAITRALSGSAARVHHGIWLAAAALAALLPASGIWGLFATATSSAHSQGATGSGTPLLAARLILTLFVISALWRGGRLLADTIAAWRWRKNAEPFPIAGIAPRLRAPDIEFLLSPPELDAAGPLLAGILHPVIFLPRFLASAENRNLLDAAVAHELAHVRRNDMPAYVLSELVLTPLAFHPMTPWLRRKLGESREMACDEQAARESLSPVAYARCLVEVARHIVGVSAPMQALGVAEGGILERRIRALLEMPRSAARRLNPWQKAACVLALGILCLLLTQGAGRLYLRIAARPEPPRSFLVPPPPPPPPPPPRRIL